MSSKEDRFVGNQNVFSFTGEILPIKCFCFKEIFFVTHKNIFCFKEENFVTHKNIFCFKEENCGTPKNVFVSKKKNFAHENVFVSDEKLLRRMR